MNLRTILAVPAIYVLWSVLDFVIHGVLLKPTYEETAELWRPEAEMKMGLMQLVTLTAAFVFVLIYARLIRPKSMNMALAYGLLFGVATGVSMGFGTYCYMPIPLVLAPSWLLGTLVETMAAGAVLGLMVKESGGECLVERKVE